MGRSHRPMRYGVATLAVALAVGSLFIPVIGEGMAGLLLFAVLVAAWYGGTGPGLWATALVVAILVGIFIASDQPIEPWRLWSFLVFAALGIMVTLAVTSMNSARQRAEGSEQWLAAVLTSIGDAVIATDRRGDVVFMNPVAQALTGWAQGEASGRPLTEVFRLRDEGASEPVGSPVDRALREGVAVDPNDRILTARDGTETPVAECAAPIKGSDGGIAGAVLVFRDITDKKRVEYELRETDRRKDEFLAMLGHELRNPLAAVNNAVTVLRMTDDPDGIALARDVIARQMRHLTRLVDDLLDVSRITRGKIRLRRDLVDAAPLLHHAVETVRPLVEERGHDLVVRVDGGNLPMWVDAARIEQIVVNLMTNAAKYTDPGGRIWLTAAREGDHVAITVRDTGIGIAPEKLPEIFHLFTQGERSIDRSEGGLGIGLTIVQRLAEMHGGSVSARSRGPGQGSEFTLRLPVAHGQAAGSAEADAPPNAARGCFRILVVDDNIDTARGMVRLLQLLGNEVAVAHDGPAAIETARRLRPEFLLLDIGLPGMDGYQVAATLRQDPDLKDVTIIGVSGYGQEEDRRRSQAAGFDHHLVKPVDFDLLVSLLTVAVG